MSLNKILVLTPTLGNRQSLGRTINSVRQVGGDKVKHVIVCPEQVIPQLKQLYGDIDCLPEPQGKKGIYPALNHGFYTYGKDYEYLTFINDDDFWLPDFRQLIDAMENDKELVMAYSKTLFVNEKGDIIGKQTSSAQFYHFLELCHRGIILLTQQSTLIKSKAFFDIGGFDETYKLVADTKFWLQLSLLRPKFKYIKCFSSCYTFQESQLSNDKITQKNEHRRLEKEFPIKHLLYSYIISWRYRLLNIGVYIERFK